MTVALLLFTTSMTVNVACLHYDQDRRFGFFNRKMTTPVRVQCEYDSSITRLQYEEHDGIVCLEKM